MSDHFLIIVDFFCIFIPLKDHEIKKKKNLKINISRCIINHGCSLGTSQLSYQLQFLGLFQVRNVDNSSSSSKYEIPFEDVQSPAGSPTCEQTAQQKSSILWVI